MKTDNLLNRHNEMISRYTHYDYIIVGLGKTGLSAARYCLAKGFSFAVMDTREQPPLMQQLKDEYPDAEVITGDLSTDILNRANEVIVSPGVSLTEPELVQAQASNINLTNDVEIFCQNIHSPILAVTGSNGKSTVVTLVHELLINAGINSALGGNIGVPVLELLQQPEPEVYVLELSSFQLEAVKSMDAQAAVVLNISEDHMDRYENIEAYVEAKARIFRGSGAMILNRDDEFVLPLTQQARHCTTFGLGEPEEHHYGLREASGTTYLMRGDEILLSAEDIKLKGQHNYLNCLAAIALVETYDIPLESIKNTLAKFPGLPHRCEWVREIEGVNWYNDSKGTNVGATCAAIAGLTNTKNIILIVGGVGKGADFSALNDSVKKHVKSVIAFGEDAATILNALDADVRMHRAINLAACVQLAAALSQENDLVLFSPACASFDMFDNYQHRGEIFTKLVHELEREFV